jgi:peptidoglycan/xylan/chitin deacetylase (PgdA/CDA1 family)
MEQTMKVIISLDTEDYISTNAVEAQKWWAKTLSDHGVRASFQCVGELVRKWLATGRFDVIDAVAQHEIGFHTNYHSLHPTHPEALQNFSFEKGVEWALERENSGVETIRKTFGLNPITYCPPGDSWTPATIVAMAHLGIKVCSDAPFGEYFKKPLWFCGTILAHYRFNFESFYNLEDPLTAFQTEYERISIELGDDGGPLVIYTHPTTLLHSTYWDVPLANGKELEIAEIPPPKLRSKSDVEKNKIFVNKALNWLSDVQSVEFTDYLSIFESSPQESRNTLDVLFRKSGCDKKRFDCLLNASRNDEALISNEMVDSFNYSWLIHSPDLNAKKIMQDMKHLLWTSAPLIKS